MSAEIQEKNGGNVKLKKELIERDDNPEKQNSIQLENELHHQQQQQQQDNEALKLPGEAKQELQIMLDIQKQSAECVQDEQQNHSDSQAEQQLAPVGPHSQTHQNNNNNNNNSSNAQQQQTINALKQKRRTRNDTVERNYTCGCSKSYLSYPALYTHMKQKHDGKPPEGTSLPQNPTKSSRGRPKKEDKIGEEKMTSPYESQIIIQDLLQFLDTLGQGDYRKREAALPEENTVKMEQRDFDEFIPREFFVRSDDCEPLLHTLRALVEERELKEELDEREIKNTSLNKIFAIFINFLQKFVNDVALREIILFLCLYRKALNQFGYRAIQEQTQLDRNKEFCQVQNGENALLICNDFIIEILPSYLQRDLKPEKLKELQILGDSDEKLKNAVYLIQHFANWMFANKYTSNRLVIRADEE